MSPKFICVTLLLLAVSAFGQAADNYADFVYDVATFLKDHGQHTVPLPSRVGSSNINLLQFAEGFLNGVDSAANFDQLRGCITESEDVYTDVDNAIVDIKTRKAAEVKAGIALLGQAAKIVPTAAQECQAGDEEIKKLVQAVETFQNPKAFLYFIGKSLLINHVQVIHEVENIVNAYQAQNSTDLGYWVGKTMDTILLNQASKVGGSNIDLLQFAEGFLNGVDSAANFDQLRGCITESEDVFADVDTGINDIKTRNAAQVKAGIALLGAAAKIVPAAAQECEAGDEEIKKLVQAVETFKNPEAFLYYVGKSLLINHVEVIHDVENIVNAYQAQNSTDLGFWVGKTMDTILLNQATKVAASNINFLQFAEGFLNGVDSAANFDQLRGCITESEDVYTDVDDGIADIKTRNIANVKAGIALLGQAAKIVPTAAQQCKAGDAEINKLIQAVETFKNPESFLYYVGKSLLINHVEVIHEVENIVNAYQAQNSTDLGYWVGKTMDTVLLNQNIVYIPRDTKTDVLNFAKGFLFGISNASIFDNIKTCIVDSEDVISDVETGVADIKTKDAAKVKQGVALLAAAAKIVPNAIQACKAADADVQHIVTLIESFSTPESFLYYIGKSLLINRVEVIHEVESAVNAYDDKDFTTLGYWVGKAMDTILLGQSHVAPFTPAVKDTKDDIVSFVKGFLDGFGSAAAFDNVRACIVDVETFASDVKNGIEDIQTKNPAKVKEGVALLGQAANIVPTAVKQCKAADANLAALIAAVESFTSPASFLYHVGKSLLINHVEVIHDVEGAVDAYVDADYQQVGYWVGKATSTIVLGEDRVISQDYVHFLNKHNNWEAKINPMFEGLTIREIKSRFLGANVADLSQFDNLTVLDYEGVPMDIPTSFNASEQWPGCVHAIRDQGQCGSCWAFAASEVLSDRFCIATNGQTQVVLSPQYLISCNNVLNHGCNGGVPLFSWWFITGTGLVSDDCLPYQSASGNNPVKCKDFTTCQDGSAIKNYFGKKDSVVQLPNPASIQANLIQYGPVEAAFTVYEDFMNYKGGIYTHTSGAELGGHAVKIIGWGNEDGTNYWIVANSWTASWGENGFFRIAWGQCGIDAACVAGQADTDRLHQSEARRFW